MSIFKPKKRGKDMFRGRNLLVQSVRLDRFFITNPLDGLFRGCDSDFEEALDKCTYEINHKGDENERK